MFEKPAISSTLLGMNAYAKAAGRGRVQTPRVNSAERIAKPMQERIQPERSKKDTKEMKISVLKSLQAQSNAGLVKIRDVSSALDDILKNA